MECAPKQFSHFLRSVRWPPTSNRRYRRSPTFKIVSLIPVVFTRHRKMSSSEGTKLVFTVRSTFSKKYCQRSVSPCFEGRALGRTSAESFNWNSLLRAMASFTPSSAYRFFTVVATEIGTGHYKD